MGLTYASVFATCSASTEGQICDPVEMFRIPDHIRDGVWDLGLNFLSIKDPPRKHIDRDHVQRAWQGDGFRLCHGCSGYYGWFVTNHVNGDLLLWDGPSSSFVRRHSGSVETRLNNLLCDDGDLR